MEAIREEKRGMIRFLVAEGAATSHKVKTPRNDIGQNHLLHDNAHPHTANPVTESFRDLTGKHLNVLFTAQIFPLVTSTFLDDLKKDILGLRFHSDEEMQEWLWLTLWIHQQPLSFYKTGIDSLVSQ